MGTKIHPKSMKNRGCVADAFLDRFGAALGRQMLSAPDAFGSLLGPFWRPFSTKNPKKGAKRAQRDPKVRKKGI